MKKIIFLSLLLTFSQQVLCQEIHLPTLTSDTHFKTDDKGNIFIYNIGQPFSTIHKTENINIQEGQLHGKVRSIASEQNLIQIRVFLDSNENGIKDLDENYMVMGKAGLIDDTFYHISSLEGIHYYAYKGTYDFVCAGIDKGFRYTTDKEITVTIADTDSYTPIDFGVAPEEEYQEATLYLTSDPFRCFRPVDYCLSIRNTGTQAIETLVFLETDNRIEEIFYLDPPDLVTGSHLFAWEVNLLPGQSRKIKYKLTAPEVATIADVGEIYKSKAWVILNENKPKEVCLEQELRCSYDPNDKLVYPNRKDSLALLDQELVYTIRFQNTGNDVADDVVVVDTLSRHLDLSTFTFIETSHPDNLRILFGNESPEVVNFEFKNIFLPDSTSNEPASNGHVTFSIKPKEGLPEYTEINNTGHIYFDFNPAIVTNITSSTLVEEYPVTSTDEVNQDKKPEILFYPNPTCDHIHFTKKLERVQVFDIQGLLIKDFPQVKSINLANHPPGTYFLRAKTGEKIEYGKVILIKN